MILVVGSTGFLGTAICARLRDEGKKVRAMVREDSDPAKKAALSALGVELVTADLKHRDKLAHAVEGVDVVVSTASATISRREGDSIESVDRDGQIALVAAAEKAKVGQFVFVSFAPGEYDSPLQSAKKAVEDRVLASSMKGTVLQPIYFMEVWLSPMLGFDPAGGKARVLGTGEHKVSWGSLMDTAAFATAAVGNEKTYNKRFPIGGPDDLSMLEVVKIFERAAGKKIELEHVPVAALEAQWKTGDAMERSFAALMLGVAKGTVIDSRPALAAMNVKRTSVAEMAARFSGA